MYARHSSNLIAALSQRQNLSHNFRLLLKGRTIVRSCLAPEGSTFTPSRVCDGLRSHYWNSCLTTFFSANISIAPMLQQDLLRPTTEQNNSSYHGSVIMVFQTVVFPYAWQLPTIVLSNQCNYCVTGFMTTCYIHYESRYILDRERVDDSFKNVLIS